MHGTADDICLSLPARAEHIAVVRQVVGSLAGSSGIDPPGVDDAKLAVTEACTNVVRHAYRGTIGRLHVLLRPATDRLLVVVRDEGDGTAAPGEGHADSAGLGLPLMRSLAQEFELLDVPGDGTEVRMAFHAGADTLEAA